MKGYSAINSVAPRKVSVSLTQTIIRTLQHLGISNTDALLRQAGIDPDQLNHTDNRILFEQQLELWRIAHKAARTDDFPILFAQQSQFATYSLTGHIATNVATMNDSWDATVQYQELAGQGGQMSISRNSDAVALTYIPFLPDDPASNIRSCSMLASITSIGRWMVGPIYTPKKLELCLPKPEDTSTYDKFFKCQILFNQTLNRITFDSSIGDIKVPYANLEVLKIMKEKADTIIVELSSKDSFSRQVSQLITSTLMQEEPDKSTIAERLNISPRTLQRKLAKENTSYQQLLDETRYQLAQNYLQDEQLTITDVAYLLGFTEPSAFYRAFKKWHEMTPGQYRETINITLNNND